MIWKVRLIAEAPKILPHRDAMRSNIGATLGNPPERVGIKASTNKAWASSAAKKVSLRWPWRRWNQPKC
jgi:2C-methyl-D-erythritol 2,4-cyclodiphosphate synthase